METGIEIVTVRAAIFTGASRDEDVGHLVKQRGQGLSYFVSPHITRLHVQIHADHIVPHPVSSSSQRLSEVRIIMYPAEF
jgi:hypothetical protein